MFIKDFGPLIWSKTKKGMHVKEREREKGFLGIAVVWYLSLKVYSEELRNFLV